VPDEWVGYIKNTIAEVAPNFTMRRMLNDYREQYYLKLFERKKILSGDHYSNTRLLAQWKNDMRRKWDNFEVESLNFTNPQDSSFKLGSDYSGTAVIVLNDIPADSLGLELIVINGKGSRREIVMKEEFKLVKVKDGKATFSIRVKPTRPGSFTFGVRAFPKHELLPHKQDFNLVRWI
jgi:phosphorylase/glycogen(starch) synthase